jgi:hypothetical protein
MGDPGRREEVFVSASSNEIASPTSQETTPTPDSVIRIVHQNINGVQALANFNEVGVIVDQVVENNIDVLTLNEVNVNVQSKTVRAQYLRAYHKIHRACSNQISWAPTNIPADMYRPGGTQVSIFGSMVSSIQAKEFDKIAGSWSLTTVSTKNGPLTIISAYRVSQSKLGKLGAHTIYSQEYMALVANGVSNPEPRKRILQELTRLIQQKTDEGHMVLVNMDSNESIEENKDLKAFQEASHLVDLIATFSPSQVNLPTHLRGKKRIDHSFCTHNLLPFVISATICQSLSLSDTDHRAIEVTLDRQKLMKKTKASHRPPQRKLSQKNPASVRRYQELVTKYFDDHNLLARIQMVKNLLEEEPELDLDLKEEMLNQLDAEKTRLMLAAEKRCSKAKRFGIYHWSPILAAAGKSYSAAKKAVKKLLRAQDSTGIAIACAKDEVKVCRGNLKDAQKEAAENRSRHLEERAELLKELRNTEAEHIVEEIKKVEEAVEMARKLRPHNNTQRSGPLDHVLLPQDDGTWRKVESPLAVESAILKQNQQDLEYANDCPFLQPPLFSQLGPLGDQMGADNLLQGIVDVDTSAYSNQRELDALLVRLKKSQKRTSTRTSANGSIENCIVRHENLLPPPPLGYIMAITKPL